MTPTPTPTPRLSFGPESGTLDHDTVDGSAMLVGDVITADLVAESMLRPPRIGVGGAWSAGLRLRMRPGPAGAAHAIVIERSGNWRHELLREGAALYETIREGKSSSVLGDEVHVRVVAVESAGWLFINGVYEAELDLSGLTESGAVGLFAKSEDSTVPTRFSGFTVRRLGRAYGPRDGAIHHDPDDGLLDMSRASVSVVDGVIEARFFNPYSIAVGPWSSGFLIRGGSANLFHAVVFNEYSRWFHYLRTGHAVSERELANEASDLLSNKRNGSNHVRIIALGDEGWLFINGSYVDELDLSDWVGAGSVSAVGQYFAGDGVAGQSTRFEGFTIWSVGAAR